MSKLDHRHRGEVKMSIGDSGELLFSFVCESCYVPFSFQCIGRNIVPMHMDDIEPEIV